LEDLGEARDEVLAVRLVDSVLHAVVDHVGLRRRLTEGSGEKGDTLQVEDDIFSLVGGGQNAACACSANLELRDDGNALDLLGPRETNVSADVVRRDGRLQASVHTTLGCGKDLSQRNFLALHVLGVEFLEVAANEATVKGQRQRCRDASRS